MATFLETDTEVPIQNFFLVLLYKAMVMWRVLVVLLVELRLVNMTQCVFIGL